MRRLGFRLLVVVATAALVAIFAQAPAVDRPVATYTDPVQGFSLRLPAGMRVDRSRAPVTTEIFDDEARVQVFHEHLDKDTLASNYVYYKSRPMRTGVDPVRVTLDRSFEMPGWTVHDLRWTRPRLRGLRGDRNHYATFDFVAGPKEVWSVHVKARDERWIRRHADGIMASFAALPARQEASTPPPRPPRPRAVRLTRDARATFEDLFLEGRQTWGIFEHGTFADYGTLHGIEDVLGHRFRVVLEYIMINETRTLAILEAARREGRVVELTLQLAPPDGASSAAFVYEVLDGKHDAALRRIARDVATFEHPVIFRLNNEMNGDWVVYSGYWTSQDPEIFVGTWKRVFEIFAEEGARNAIWVWNPHDRSFPPFRYNDALMYYPGSAYVDVIGITGYNNGTYFPNETWRTFDEIYRPIYDEYRHLFPGKPFMITEFASSTIGGDKAAWIRDMMQRLPAYPNIGIAVWWNGIDMDGDVPARPYRLDGEAVMAAFRHGLAAYD